MSGTDMDLLASQTLEVPLQTSTTKEDKENYQLTLFIALTAMSLVYAVFFGNFLALDFDSDGAAYSSAKFFLLFLTVIKILGMAFAMFSSGDAYATDNSNFPQIALALVAISFFYTIFFLLIPEAVWWGDSCANSICRGIGGGTSPTASFYILFVTTILSGIVELVVIFFLTKLIAKQDFREQRNDVTLTTEMEPPVYPATESKKKSKIPKHFTDADKKTVHDVLVASENLDEYYNILNIFLLFSVLPIAFSMGNFLALESEDYYGTNVAWWFTWLFWYKLPIIVFALFANGRTRVARTTKMLDYTFTMYLISVIYIVVYAIVFYVPLFFPCTNLLCYGVSNNAGTPNHKSLGYVIFGWLVIFFFVFDAFLLLIIRRTRKKLRKRNTVLLKSMEALQEGEPMAWVRDALARYGYVFAPTIESKICDVEQQSPQMFRFEVAEKSKNVVVAQSYENFLRQKNQ